MKKIFVLGLDCLPPQLWDRIPVIKKLRQTSIHGNLKSSNPPSSINAWASMFTSREYFDFYDYIIFNKNEFRFVDSSVIKDETVWDVLSKNNKKVGVVNVPMTFPPREIHGIMVSDVLANEGKGYTYPPELEQDLKDMVNYTNKIPDARKLSPEKLLESIWKMTDMRFKAIRYLLSCDEWDFFIGVIYATDALMHNFFKYFGDNHPKKFEVTAKTEKRINEYFKFISKNIEETLEMLDKDTVVILMSDHGAKTMKQRFNINEWLFRRGYLVLNGCVKEPTPIHKVNIDWKRTKAYGLGAYYCQLFILDRSVRSKLLQELKFAQDYVIRTDFPKTKNAPDAILYFNNGSVGTNPNIGLSGLKSYSTDKGPDDAVHCSPGYYMIYNLLDCEEQRDADIIDISPTILNIMDVKSPKSFQGGSII